jgi:peptidoglycan/LPS O-acetylase OafA/YrhL
MLKRTYGDKATKWQQAGSIVGLALIVFTLFSLDGQSSFPGWNALAPTVGAALMIGCGPQTLTARRIFSLRAIVWVGLISFPLYLWHWPLLTFARIISSASCDGCTATSASTAAAGAAVRDTKTPESAVAASS